MNDKYSDEFILHKVLNKLHTSFDHVRVTYNAYKDTWKINLLISIYVHENLMINLSKVDNANLVVQSKPQSKSH